ncbi:MAG: glycerophosphodiester phosphodiesterase [Gemmatimonadetes bacterium]|nr:glycerophosphodiester phosphodiesterase [Gemmatimonadota bacterium]
MHVHGTPIVIAHRGASGHRPEHTLEAYRLAIEMGADFVEPDLVSTADGVLVCRHENEIGGTTDVAAHPELAARRTSKVIDGVAVEGWFTEDFTLAELKTLRARERLPQLRPGNAEFDGRFEVPTFEEVVALVQRESAARGRTIGIYPETKHPGWFQSLGVGLEEPLLSALERAGWTDADAPVFVQSFETENLRMLRASTRVRLIQLMESSGRPYDFARGGDPRTYADLARPRGLAEIAGYADGIGPDKALVIPRDAGGRLAAPGTLVADAHAAGLLVHPWTFRSENHFLPAGLHAGDPAAPGFPRLHGNAEAELAAFFTAGVDGVFADFPDVAVRVRAALA